MSNIKAGHNPYLRCIAVLENVAQQHSDFSNAGVAATPNANVNIRVPFDNHWTSNPASWAARRSLHLLLLR
jgi:hypothetical protein